VDIIVMPHWQAFTDKAVYQIRWKFIVKFKKSSWAYFFVDSAAIKQ